MDVAGSMFTGLTLASIITTGGLVINLTQNFGTLANNGDVLQEAGGNRLVGTYGNAVTGMSAVVVGLSALYLIFYMYGWYKMRGNRTVGVQRVYWTVILLSVMLGVAAAGINLNLTENFGGISNLEFSPAVPVPGTNYQLAGSYGTATLAMAATSLSMAGLAWLWMMGLWWRGWGVQTGFAAEVGGIGVGLGLTDTAGSRRKGMLDFTEL